MRNVIEMNEPTIKVEIANKGTFYIVEINRVFDMGTGNEMDNEVENILTWGKHFSTFIEAETFTKRNFLFVSTFRNIQKIYNGASLF